MPATLLRISRLDKKKKEEEEEYSAQVKSHTIKIPAHMRKVQPLLLVSFKSANQTPAVVCLKASLQRPGWQR